MNANELHNQAIAELQRQLSSLPYPAQPAPRPYPAEGR